MRIQIGVGKTVIELTRSDNPMKLLLGPPGRNRLTAYLAQAHDPYPRKKKDLIYCD